ARGPDRHRELATPLQHDQAPRLTWIQATSAGGVRARLRRVAGCATPSGSAGHAGETANLKLTFHLDHSAGTDLNCCANGTRTERQMFLICLADLWAPRSLVHSVPRPRMLDEHHLRSLGKL